ncbi:MAG TPA: DUF542 domain-containing protein [Longimicrobiales bacterium]
MNSEAIISPEMTVNEIVQRYPTTLPVFRSFGIDTCCGGALPLATVLEKHRLDDASVLEALRSLVIHSVSREDYEGCCELPSCSL